MQPLSDLICCLAADQIQCAAQRGVPYALRSWLRSCSLLWGFFWGMVVAVYEIPQNLCCFYSFSDVDHWPLLFQKKKKIHWPPLFPYSLLSLSCSWSSASAWCWLFWATCLGSSMPSMSSWQLILRNTVVITGSLFMDSHIASLMVWIKTWTFQGLSQLVKLLEKKKNRTGLSRLVWCSAACITSFHYFRISFSFTFTFFFFLFFLVMLLYIYRAPNLDHCEYFSKVDN